MFLCYTLQNYIPFNGTMFRYGVNRVYICRLFALRYYVSICRIPFPVTTTTVCRSLPPHDRVRVPCVRVSVGRCILLLRFKCQSTSDLCRSPFDTENNIVSRFSVNPFSTFFKKNILKTLKTLKIQYVH